eukprot:Phypoly_transcript_04404.p1 GENE.Phypoly_transcript_04404~~Phypoly_transcript_04404.p1  ORF type:complete len:567 (+),score=64.08 Phypoly_transcript_04404:352-2052(+)
MRLITISCWWDGTAESLSSTINFLCPDLVPPNSVPPIALNPPPTFFMSKAIPYIGELMYASFSVNLGNLNLISRYSWWLGEKYDGVRCCWNAVDSSLYTRQGSKLEAHPQFYKFMPEVAIDAEIWYGRRNFSLALQLIPKSVDLIVWDSLRFIAFDCPAVRFQPFPFELRYKKILDNLPSDHPFLIIAPRFLLQSTSDLAPLATKIIADGGEGVTLRQVHSVHKSGRSNLLLKFKLHLEDREGIVTKVAPSRVQIKLPNDDMLTIQSQNVHISNIKVGEIVTVSLDRNAPANAVVQRRRMDVMWNDVLSSFSEERKFLEAKPISTEGSSKREVFERFATENHFDPLIPANWYSQRRSVLLSSPEIQRMIRNDARQSVSQALIDSFPEIGLESGKLWNLRRRLLKMRHFFEKFARTNNFDPLVPRNWYSQSKSQILAAKDSHLLGSFYRDNLSKALFDSFPGIGFKRTKFWKLPLWKHPAERRKLLEKYAKENNFDPLNPENWYSQSRQKMYLFPGMRGIVSYHGESALQTIIDLFPDIGLEKSKFRRIIKPRKTNTEKVFTKNSFS